MKTLLTSLFIILFTFTVASAQDARADYYENGQKKYQGNVQNGKKVGEWVYYHDNGQVSREGIYKDGAPFDLWKEYYRSGQVKSEGKYVVVKGEAVKHGLWTTYHKNGAKEFEGRYESGKAVGTWLEFNTLGIEVNKVNH
jgi:antitoxin component YwqK of YwqJK toxin-antitoxin module